MADNTPGVDEGDLLFDELNRTLTVQTKPTATPDGAPFSPVNLDDSLSPPQQPYSLDNAPASESTATFTVPSISSDIPNGSNSQAADPILTGAPESSLANGPNLDKIAKLYEKYSFQCGELERLEKQNEEYREQLLRTIRERDNFEQGVKDVKEETSSRILDLERKLLEHEYQLKATKDRMAAQESHFRKTANEVQTKFNAQTDALKKSTDTAQREKDEAVIKYAMRESEILRLNGERQKLADQLKQVTVERDALTARLRGSKNEKESAKSTVEQMECQLSDMKRELDSQTNLVKEADVRVKIANKRAETIEAAHKETKVQLENATKQVSRLQEENAAIRADHRKLIGEFQQRNEQSTKNFQIQQQEVSEQEGIHKAMADELEALKKQHRSTLKDVEALRNELEKLKADCDRLTNELDAEKSDHADDRKELDRLKDIETLVESSRKQAQEAEKAAAEAREDRDQAEREAADCRKQAERMLEITEQLTEKNSRLTSDSDVFRTKLRECSEVETESTRLASRLSEAERELSQLRACSGAEIESLKRQLDEKIRKEQELMTAVEDERNEVKVLKRKHAASLKELRTELSTMKRRLNAYESGTASLGGLSDAPHEGVSMSSRASSVTSLEAVAGQRSSTDAPSPVTTTAPSASSAGDNGSVNGNDPHASNSCQQNPNQAMIEKIVKLQRQLARRAEKIEFLEEHVRQCVDELKKKTKIIQYFALREEAGALVPESSDMNKLMELCEMAEAQLAKKGGSYSLIGSMFHVPGGDKAVSAELSMEINARLQAVLEDTLIKNITLKENLDTLGQEISRLSRENRQLSLVVSK